MRPTTVFRKSYKHVWHIDVSEEEHRKVGIWRGRCGWVWAVPQHVLRMLGDQALETQILGPGMSRVCKRCLSDW